MTISMCACGGVNCPHCNPSLWTNARLPVFQRTVDYEVLRLQAENAELKAELAALRESMRAGSLLRKVGEPLPKGCYCTPGRCAAPKPEWCRDSAKRDYEPPEDSSDA